MSTKSSKRSGFPGGGGDDELKADFEAWDDNFGELFAEPTGAGGQAGQAPARAQEQAQRPAAQEFEFELSMDAPGDIESAPGGESQGEGDLDLQIDVLSPPLAADVDAGDLESALDQPQSLGQLLGMTSPIEIDDIDDGDADAGPLPPPFEQDSGAFPLPQNPTAAVDGLAGEDDGEEVLTSAARPLRGAAGPSAGPGASPAARPSAGPRMGPSAGTAAGPAARSPAAPTSARVRPGSVMDSFQPVSAEGDDDDFDPFGDPEEGSSSQVTKVVKVDESLLAAAVPDEPAPKRARRRAPTIVRRDELERLRAERATNVDDLDDEEPDFGQDTQLLSSEQLETLAGETGPADTTPVVVDLDTDFYDDIVIGDSGESAAPQVDVPAEITPAVRRVSPHVVRRDTLQPLRDAERPKPVLRPRSRRGRNSEQELASHLETSRSFDPDSTLDLRVSQDGTIEPSPNESRSRAEEIQAIIDRAARELRGQHQEPAAQEPAPLPPVVLPPEEASVAGEAFEDFELDWEIEPETKPAAPGLAATAAAAGLDELANIPGLPAPVLPTGDVAQRPALDVARLAIPEAVAPLTRAELGAREGELAATLERYEHAVLAATQSEQAARLHLEAGRMSEQLGRADRAREHYEGALGFAPRLLPALRGLRRIERVQGRWSDAVHALDREVAEVTPLEQRALRGHRIDLLLAHGERELAGDTVAELGSDAGADPRVLLTRLELALADRRDADAALALAQLAERMTDRALDGTLARMRGVIEEHMESGGEPGSVFAVAAAAGASTAFLAAAGSEAITAIISGKTISGTNIDDRQNVIWYFAPDGLVKMRKKNITWSGKWRIDDTARLCIQFQDPYSNVLKKEGCRILSREDDKLLMYGLTKDGQRAGETLSIEKITDGNTENL